MRSKLDRYLMEPMQTFRYFMGVSIGTVIVLSVLKSSIAQSTSPDTSPQESLAPSNLNPSPNLLDLPTQPNEVKLQGVQPITLPQALELAQKNNRELQVAALTLQRSQAALRQAKAAQFPTIGAEADLQTDRSAPERLIDLKLGDTTTTPGTAFLSGTVGINYDLYTSGRRSAQIKVAQERVSFEELELNRLKEQTRLDVTNAYYDLQEADQQVRIAQAALINIQRNLQDAIALARNGSGAQFDVLRTQVQLGNAEQSLVQAQTQQDIARRQLAQRLSLSQTADIAAADRVQLSGSWALSLEESIILAFKNRVELEQQLTQQRISQQQRRVALAEIKPQVSLFANYQVLQGLDPLNVVDGYSAGAKLRWNFFDGGAAKASAAQENANIAIAQTRFADTRNQIRFQVEQAYKTLKANVRNIQTAEQNLSQANQALEVARVRFQAGVGTQLELSTAQNELIQADVNRVRAILNYNRALAALERAAQSALVQNLKAKKD